MDLWCLKCMLRSSICLLRSISTLLPSAILWRLWYIFLSFFRPFWVLYHCSLFVHSLASIRSLGSSSTRCWVSDCRAGDRFWRGTVSLRSNGLVDLVLSIRHFTQQRRSVSWILLMRSFLSEAPPVSTRHSYPSRFNLMSDSGKSLGNSTRHRDWWCLKCMLTSWACLLRSISTFVSSAIPWRLWYILWSFFSPSAVLYHCSLLVHTLASLSSLDSSSTGYRVAFCRFGDKFGRSKVPLRSNGLLSVLTLFAVVQAASMELRSWLTERLVVASPYSKVSISIGTSGSLCRLAALGWEWKILEAVTPSGSAPFSIALRTSGFFRKGLSPAKTSTRPNW